MSHSGGWRKFKAEYLLARGDIAPGRAAHYCPQPSWHPTAPCSDISPKVTNGFADFELFEVPVIVQTATRDSKPSIWGNSPMIFEKAFSVSRAESPYSRSVGRGSRRSSPSGPQWTRANRGHPSMASLPLRRTRQSGPFRPNGFASTSRPSARNISAYRSSARYSHSVSRSGALWMRRSLGATLPIASVAGRSPIHYSPNVRQGVPRASPGLASPPPSSDTCRRTPALTRERPPSPSARSGARRVERHVRFCLVATTGRLPLPEAQGRRQARSQTVNLH